ncbi:MAG TPA: hypothetical protein VGN14_02130 [Candidatus Elarobacter sp.]|jgi:Flp pilus assembly pilin Flp
MNALKALRALRALVAAEDGAMIVEYALILALLSAASIGALFAIGVAATAELTSDGTALTSAGRNTP